MGGPELKRKMTDWKNASRKIPYQHERSHRDQNKYHYSTGPSCATSGYLGKPDQTYFDRPNKRPRANYKDDKSHISDNTLHYTYHYLPTPKKMLNKPSGLLFL